MNDLLDINYQSSISEVVEKKKLIKLTVTHPGQETRKCAKTVPKITPFENISLFIYSLISLPFIVILTLIPILSIQEVPFCQLSQQLLPFRVIIL